MNSAPRVIVSGMVAGTPGQGGATWAVLQYLIGLRQLGCDVWFVEPVAHSQPDGLSARYGASVLERFGFDGRWALVPRSGDGEPVGMGRAELRAIARSADLLLNVSGMLTDVDVFEHVDVRVYLDLDPVFIQLWHAAEGVDMRLDGHTHFVTLSDAIGTPDSRIPDCGRSWIPTLPPVVLDQWPVAGVAEHDAFTTVGHWRGYGSIDYGGVHYGQKAHSLRAFADLPSRLTERVLVALAIDPAETSDLATLAANGWDLVDPAVVAATPDAYRRFVQTSRAELGVTKSGYVVSGSGWFSDRSACYLASGRPVVAQDTGFSRRLPTGAGLFSFRDAGDVVVAADQLRADYARHRSAARQVAEEHLAADKVLRSLLERVGSS